MDPRIVAPLAVLLRRAGGQRLGPVLEDDDCPRSQCCRFRSPRSRLCWGGYKRGNGEAGSPLARQQPLLPRRSAVAFRDTIRLPVSVSRVDDGKSIWRWSGCV